MLALDLLPDLRSQLTPLEFARELSIHIDAPADVTHRPTITIEVDGQQLPTVAGEITMPTY
jgi:hypothetical protein